MSSRFPPGTLWGPFLLTLELLLGCNWEPQLTLSCDYSCVARCGLVTFTSCACKTPESMELSLELLAKVNAIEVCRFDGPALGLLSP
jgi:hypothetical protein